jgi:hypothetical protein
MEKRNSAESHPHDSDLADPLLPSEKGPSERSPSSLRTRPNRPKRRRRSSQPQSAGHAPSNALTKLLASTADLVALIFHGITGAMLHVVGSVVQHLPQTPMGLLGVIIMLTPILILIANERQHAQNVCFGCLAVLALIASGLILILMKAQGSTNPRLRDMQHDRLATIRVKAIRPRPDRPAREDSRG